MKGTTGGAGKRLQQGNWVPGAEADGSSSSPDERREDRHNVLAGLSYGYLSKDTAKNPGRGLSFLQGYL